MGVGGGDSNDVSILLFKFPGKPLLNMWYVGFCKFVLCDISYVLKKFISFDNWNLKFWNVSSFIMYCIKRIFLNFFYV